MPGAKSIVAVRMHFVSGKKYIERVLSVDPVNLTFEEPLRRYKFDQIDGHRHLHYLDQLYQNLRDRRNSGDQSVIPWLQKIKQRRLQVRMTAEQHTFDRIQRSLDDVVDFDDEQPRNYPRPPSPPLPSPKRQRVGNEEKPAQEPKQHSLEPEKFVSLDTIYVKSKKPKIVLNSWTRDPNVCVPKKQTTGNVGLKNKLIEFLWNNAGEEYDEYIWPRRDADNVIESVEQICKRVAKRLHPDKLHSLNLKPEDRPIVTRKYQEFNDLCSTESRRKY